MKATPSRIQRPEPEGVSQEMGERLATFLGPRLSQRDERMDRRLVGNVAAIIVGLVRNRRQGIRLVLTERGEKPASHHREGRAKVRSAVADRLALLGDRPRRFRRSSRAFPGSRWWPVAGAVP